MHNTKQHNIWGTIKQTQSENQTEHKQQITLNTNMFRQTIYVSQHKATHPSTTNDNQKNITDIKQHKQYIYIRLI